MKKFFALAAVAAMFIACGPKEENKPNGGENNGGNTEEPAFVSPIKVDGSFEDWAGLDASKVASCVKPEGLVKHDGLVSMKVYADAMNINVYFEFDDVVIADKSSVPVHFYINADNDASTGGGDSIWFDLDEEWLLEGWIFSEGAFCSYDPGVYPWAGEVGVADWAWGESVLPDGSNVSSGAGNGNAYELQIVREMLPFELADTFTIGMDIQQNWDSVGYLPCDVMTDENTEGATYKLVVTVDK